MSKPRNFYTKRI